MVCISVPGRQLLSVSLHFCCQVFASASPAVVTSRRRLEVPYAQHPQNYAVSTNRYVVASNVGKNIAVNPAKCPKRSIVQNASHLLGLRAAERLCQLSSAADIPSQM